jgi:hypothetical protein
MEAPLKDGAMPSRSQSLFGKSGVLRYLAVLVLVFAALLAMNLLLLIILPSPYRIADDGQAQWRSRRPILASVAPAMRFPRWPPSAAAGRQPVDEAFDLSADNETIALYCNLVRFWGLDMEIGEVAQISFSRDMTTTAENPGLAQNIAAFSTGQDTPVLLP